MQKLWETPIDGLRREVETMAKQTKYASDFDRQSLAQGIRMREEEIARRTSPPRPEIEDLKAVWESLTEAERREFAAWIDERISKAVNKAYSSR